MTLTLARRHSIEDAAQSTVTNDDPSEKMGLLLNKWNVKSGMRKDDCAKANQKQQREHWNEPYLCRKLI